MKQRREKVIGVRLSSSELEALRCIMRHNARPHVSEAVREILRQEFARIGIFDKVEVHDDRNANVEMTQIVERQTN